MNNYEILPTCKVTVYLRDGQRDMSASKMVRDFGAETLDLIGEAYDHSPWCLGHPVTPFPVADPFLGDAGPVPF